MLRPLQLSIALAPFCATAQNAYTFTQTTEPYVELTAATPCVFDGNGLDILTELNGETFSFYGTPTTMGGGNRMMVGDWGFVRMDNTTSSVIMDGLFTGLTPVDASSTIIYNISGATGSKVLAVQWTNWSIVGGPVGNFDSFQIITYQATGVVEVRIGPNSGGGMIYTSATGPNCGIFKSNPTFTTCQGKLWVEGDAYEPTLDSLPNFDFDGLLNLPPANTVYRFTPRTGNVGMVELNLADGLRAWMNGDLLEVRSPASGNGGALRILDGAGRIVARASVTDPTEHVELTGVAPGIYVLQLLRPSGDLTTRFVRP